MSRRRLQLRRPFRLSTLTGLFPPVDLWNADNRLFVMLRFYYNTHTDFRLLHIFRRTVLSAPVTAITTSQPNQPKLPTPSSCRSGLDGLTHSEGLVSSLVTATILAVTNPTPPVVMAIGVAGRIPNFIENEIFTVHPGDCRRTLQRTSCKLKVTACLVGHISGVPPPRQ